MTDSLFPDLPPGQDPPAGRTVRLRERQEALIEAGYHPLSLVMGRGHPLRLHPAAAPGGDRSAPGGRCGSCSRRFLARRTRAYPKCEIAPTRSEASDVRAWWPACVHYKPEEVTV